MSKKQTSVSHRSTESEIISLDAGLRMDGLPALDLWDMVIEVLRSTNNNIQPKHTSHQETGAVFDSKTKTQHVKRRQKVEQLSEVDYVPTKTHSSQRESQLHIFEDNEAVIKMIIEGRSPTTRHVSRTHRIALDWLFDRNNLEPKIQIKYVDTKDQLADILTKGSFSKNEWNHFLCLFNIMSFSMYSCSHFRSFLLRVTERIVIGAMSRRGQNTTSSDGSPTAKARPVNLVMRSQYKEETSSSSLGSRVNPGNHDESKRVDPSPGNWMLGDSKSEVENSQVSRQERVLQAARKLGRKDQTQIKSEENPPGTRKLAACSPEFRNMEYTNHRYMDKIFQKLGKSWECLQSAQHFQWMHTKPMY